MQDCKLESARFFLFSFFKKESDPLQNLPVAAHANAFFFLGLVGSRILHSTEEKDFTTQKSAKGKRGCHVSAYEL